MDCKLMLQSTFDWAKTGIISGGEFPEYATVFATVTIHHSLDRPDSRSDVVWYGNGPLSFKTSNGQDVLSGNIQAWINKYEAIFVPPPPDGEIGSYTYDLFPNMPELGLLLSVNRSGVITVGKLIRGRLIGGMPPSTFQGVCENGLLSGRTYVSGEAVCTVSFSLGSSLGY